MSKNNIGYISEEKEKRVFEEEVKLISKKEGFNRWTFITDDWTLGYCVSCKTCGYPNMICTNIEIPFENDKDDELNEIMDKYVEWFYPSAKYVYEGTEEYVCHCDEDGEYSFNKDTDKWEFVGFDD